MCVASRASRCAKNAFCPSGKMQFCTSGRENERQRRSFSHPERSERRLNDALRASSRRNEGDECSALIPSLPEANAIRLRINYKKYIIYRLHSLITKNIIVCINLINYSESICKAQPMPILGYINSDIGFAHCSESTCKAQPMPILGYINSDIGFAYCSYYTCKAQPMPILMYLNIGIGYALQVDL